MILGYLKSQFFLTKKNNILLLKKILIFQKIFIVNIIFLKIIIVIFILKTE